MDSNDFILILITLLAAAAVFLLFINSRHKKQMDELRRIRQQLEDLKDVPVSVREEVIAEMAEEQSPQILPQKETATKIIELTEEKQDAEEMVTETPEASTYNTGKSGKVYTKEELELLIKE